MLDLKLFSIILGFIGCFFVVFSFVCQLYEIYKTKNADGTSWGLIISQILTCLFLGTSAGINVYLDGIINLPFLVANVSLFLLFLVMVYFKIIYKKLLI
jgi:uncharacterized protein with PQ loop repeat